jgi:outer membrane protein OmpA-like peptidoglycan-associated protein
MTLRALLTAGAFALAGCAQPPLHTDTGAGERVVLLPGSDGATGALLVRQGDSEARLDSPYASAGRSAEGQLAVTQTDSAAVQAEFGELLGALPPAPVSHVVYFVLGQDELTEESRKELAPILEDIAKRPAPEIAAIGHADQTGPERVNETLAMRRAERVRDLLVQRGVPATRIEVVGRGSREPAIRAAQGVAEARNRRVEISVR